MIKSEVIIIRVEPKLKQKLQALANEDRRSLSNYIHLQLEKLTEKKK